MLRILLSGIVVTLAVCAALEPGPVAAQERNAAAPACSAANAQPMTIAAIAAAGESAIGTCVSVEGQAIWGQLHADNFARYRQITRHNDLSSTGAILGLYGNTLPAPHRAHARVIGRVDSCARMHARAVAASTPESIVMLGGYCHNFNGLTIQAASIAALGNADQIRIPAGRADPALGNLARMAPGSSRDRLLAAADMLFDALDNRDAVRAMLGRTSGGARTDAEVFAIADRLAAGAGTRTGAGVTEIFGWRTPAWANAEDRRAFDAQAERMIEGIACHSIHPDAAALWPISEGDSMLGGQRPYGCVRISIGRDGGTDYDVFNNYEDDYGIREP